MADICFRFWERSDTKLVVSLWNAIAHETNDQLVTEEAFLDQIGHPGWDPASQLRVAVANGKIIGASDIWIDDYEDGRRATLSIAVDRSWRRRRIATSLLTHAISCLPEGLDRLDVRVEEKATALKAFVTTYGLRQTSITDLMRAPLIGLPNVLPKPFTFVSFDVINSLEVFRKLHNEVFHGIPNWRPITHESMKHYVLSSWFDPSKLLFVTDSNSQNPVAWIWLSAENESNEKLLFVESLGVKPEYQRRGIGSALISWARNIGINAGATAIELSVDYANAAASRFYYNVGFAIKQRTLWFTGNRDEVRQKLAQRESSAFD